MPKIEKEKERVCDSEKAVCDSENILRVVVCARVCMRAVCEVSECVSASACRCS